MTEISFAKQQHNLSKLYGNRIPIEVQIGADSFTIKPQYPETQMRLIEILIRVIYPEIPDDEKLFINNWTAGPRIGQQVDPESTVVELLKESNQTIPKVRVCWVNCPTFKVQVDLHDILILHYDEVNIFHYMADLLDSISSDVKKRFKLKNSTVFKLRVEGDHQNYRRLVFVGKYFDLHKINKIKVMIRFQEKLPIQLVKRLNKGKFEHLICPISQLIMQEPVVTVCKHKFDKLCLSLALEKSGRCPVCRHHLEKGQFKSASQLAKQIKRLKVLQIQERIAASHKKIQESDSN